MLDHADSTVKQNLFVRVAPLLTLAAHKPLWQDLADHAVEANHFYSPGYALAAASHLKQSQDIEAVQVWGGGMLIGLFPCARHFGGLALSGWMTPYFVSSAPLLRRGLERHALSAFLDWTGTLRPRPISLSFDQLDLNGGFWRALTALARRRNLSWQMIETYERAALSCELSYADYLQTQISRSRRKNLSRRWRQLAALGRLELVTYRHPAEIGAGIKMFLDLEASGWKGRAGTALASREATQKFAAEAFAANFGSSRSRCDVLMLDDRPISASISLATQDQAWAIKSAYDERYARFAPGLLADFEGLKEMLDAPSAQQWASRWDSAAKPGHVLETLWSGRRKTGRVLISLRPGMASRMMQAQAASWRQMLRGKTKLSKWKSQRRKSVGRETLSNRP